MRDAVSPAGFVLPDESLDLPFQFSKAERLVQERDFSALVIAYRHGFTADEQHGDVHGVRELREIIAVATAQTNIGDDEDWPRRSQNFGADSALVGQCKSVTLLLQELADQDANIAIVFDDKDQRSVGHGKALSWRCEEYNRVPLTCHEVVVK